MGILEKIFEYAKEFLNEQKKTNEFLEIIANQKTIKNDFIIKGQVEASQVLGCSIPTLKKLMDTNQLLLNQDYYRFGDRLYLFSLSSLLNKKGQINENHNK